LRESGQCNGKLSPSGIVAIALICSLPTRRASIFHFKFLRSRNTITPRSYIHWYWRVFAGFLFAEGAACTIMVMQIGPCISRRTRPHMFCPFPTARDCRRPYNLLGDNNDSSRSPAHNSTSTRHCHCIILPTQRPTLSPMPLRT
jgi:hypothetical protein